MLIHKIQRKLFNMNKFWVFSKFARQISNFLTYLDCPHNENKWKKSWAIKVLSRFILEHCDRINLMSRFLERNTYIGPKREGFGIQYVSNLGWKVLNQPPFFVPQVLNAKLPKSPTFQQKVFWAETSFPIRQGTFMSNWTMGGNAEIPLTAVVCQCVPIFNWMLSLLQI